MELIMAYLAGAIDSDGCIGIRKKGIIYQERICLKQVTPQVPALLQETFGGSLMLQEPSVTRGRPLHYWEITHKGASEAAERLLPYLRIKTAQAEALLALRQSKDRPRSETSVHKDAVVSKNRWGDVAIKRWTLSPETLAEREALYQRIKRLNKVGV